MPKNKRYIFIPINEKIDGYKFYNDLITQTFFEYENETYNLNFHVYMSIPSEKLFQMAQTLYCFVGFIEFDNKYWTTESNKLLMFLQQNRLIYNTGISEEKAFSFNCIPYIFKQDIVFLKNKFKKEKKFLDNFLPKKQKTQEELILDSILEALNESVNVENIIFTKKDFQPIFFSHEVYMKHEYVSMIYKDIDNLYLFVTNSFNNFIKKSSLKEEYKNTHFLDINYDLFQYFSKLEDAVIFYDYLCLLNSESYKFTADFILSMLKQTDQKELKKIKYYIDNKENESNIYLLHHILRHYRVEDKNILYERRNKYIELIDKFREKTLTLS